LEAGIELVEAIHGEDSAADDASTVAAVLAATTTNHANVFGALTRDQIAARRDAKLCLAWARRIAAIMDPNRFAEVQWAVEDRLSFVEKILDLRPQLVTPGLMPAPKPGAKPDHPWRHFDSLMNYLLLTCFDILGQGGKFVSFEGWLHGSAYDGERESAKLCVPEGADPVAAAMALAKEYRSLYGHRVTFYRFLDEVLDSALRARLFDSLRLRLKKDATTDWTDFIEPQCPKRALYLLRNHYTHQGRSIGNFLGGIVDDWYQQGSTGYSRIFRKEKKGGTIIDVYVRRWPGVLIETVTAGLSRVGAGTDPTLGRQP